MSTCLAGLRAVRAPPRAVALEAEPSQQGRRTPWRGGRGEREGIGRGAVWDRKRGRGRERERELCVWGG